MHVKPVTWLIIGVLVLLLVVPVSATLVSINATNSGRTIRNNGNPGNNESFVALMTGNGTAVGTSEATTYSSIFSSRFTDYYNRSYRSLTTFNMADAAIPSGATIDSVVFKNVRVGSSSVPFGYINDVITEAHPVDPNVYAISDYQLVYNNYFSDRVNSSAIPASSDMNFTFNAAGIAFIQGNLTGNITLARRLTVDVDKSMAGYTWAANGTTGATSWGYNHTSYNPKLFITYHVPETTIYPIPLINNTQYLPNSDTNLPASGLNISANVTPGDYEWMSFIIKAPSAVADYAVSNTILTNETGGTIPVNATDLKLVGVWHQGVPYCTDVSTGNGDYAACSVMNPNPNFALTPELLLNNLSLIRVNRTALQNEVYVQNATFSGYRHVDNTSTAAWLTGYTLWDNTTSSGFPQNFSVLGSENQQVWVTVKAPAGTPAGNYTGQVWVNSSTTTATAVNISVRVLPFTLVNATKTNGIYYLSQYWYTGTQGTDVSGGGSRWKSLVALLADYQNMKNHGIMYPSVYQMDDGGIDAYLTTIDAVGLPHDKIYLLSDQNLSYSAYIGNGTGNASNASIAAKVLNWRNHTETYGYGKTYFWGMNEKACNTGVNTQRQAWETVHANGGYIWAAGTYTTRDQSCVADILDEINQGYYLNSTFANNWHAVPNHTITSYSNPQGTVEQPERFRKNYGLKLWVSPYDGGMTYAYSVPAAGGKSSWNEYDHTGALKSHALTYPSTDHPIDTVQWEGMREGIDDQRYADTLTSLTGSNTSALTIINNGIANGKDMSQIRVDLIEAIIAYGEGPPAPYALYTVSQSVVRVPGNVTFTDTSTGTPTSWNWSFSDGTYSETQNTTHHYVTRGYKRVCLVATNAGGSSELCDYIRVIGF